MPQGCTVVHEDPKRVSLAYYQSLTVPEEGCPRKLPDEFRGEATLCAQELYAEDKLTAEDKAWCQRNDIPYTKE